MKKAAAFFGLSIVTAISVYRYVIKEKEEERAAMRKRIIAEVKLEKELKKQEKSTSDDKSKISTQSY